MKKDLGFVLTAVNDRSKYFQKVEIFAVAWRRIFPAIELGIIYTGRRRKRLARLEELFDIVLHIKAPNFRDSVLFSQVSRIFFPGVIQSEKPATITDIDMIPLNREYFLWDTQEPKDTFIVKRDYFQQDKQLHIMYNVAYPKTWRDIFRVESTLEIKKELESLASQSIHDGLHGGRGWFRDQEILWKKVISERKTWDPNGSRLRLLKDEDSEVGFNRLDRKNPRSVRYFIDASWEDISANYTDFHMPVLSWVERRKILRKLLGQ